MVLASGHLYQVLLLTTASGKVTVRTVAPMLFTIADVIAEEDEVGPVEPLHCVVIPLHRDRRVLVGQLDVIPPPNMDRNITTCMHPRIAKEFNDLVTALLEVFLRLPVAIQHDVLAPPRLLEGDLLVGVAPLHYSHLGQRRIVFGIS